jgi:hypothetical protein
VRTIEAVVIVNVSVVESNEIRDGNEPAPLDSVEVYVKGVHLPNDSDQADMGYVFAASS